MRHHSQSAKKMKLLMTAMMRAGGSYQHGACGLTATTTKGRSLEGVLGQYTRWKAEDEPPQLGF